MLNNRKIRLMTQLALYEKREGREDIKLSKYYQSDYARFHVLRTAIFVTIGYILIAALVVMYKLEYLIDNALTLDYKALGRKALIIYIAVMAVYMIFALTGYALQYKLSRKKLGKYYRMLGKLRKIYAAEDAYGKDAADFPDEDEDEDETDDFGPQSQDE